MISRAAIAIAPYAVVALIIAAASGYCWSAIARQKTEIATLTAEVVAARTNAAALAMTLQQATKAHLELKRLAEEQQLAQTTLRQQLASVSSTSAYRKTKLEELKRELEDVKSWSDTAVPAAVIRLHQRPAIDGGANYRNWLSARDSLPVAGQQTAK